LLQGQSLTDSKVRINAYRALSSPAYISQTAQDPILEAFQLYKELYDWSNYEPEFRKDYLDLAQRCSDYAVALLGHCRRREEVSIAGRLAADSVTNLYGAVTFMTRNAVMCFNSSCQYQCVTGSSSSQCHVDFTLLQTRQQVTIVYNVLNLSLAPAPLLCH